MDISIRGTNTLVISKIVDKAMTINLRLKKTNKKVLASASRTLKEKDFISIPEEEQVSIYLNYDKLDLILKDDKILTEISRVLRK